MNQSQSKIYPLLFTDTQMPDRTEAIPGGNEASVYTRIPEYVQALNSCKSGRSKEALES